MTNQENTSQHKGQDKGKDLSCLDNRFDEKKFAPECILAEIEKCIQQGEAASENIGLLKVKPANAWIEQAKTRPVPQMLFDRFWYEGELCILFSYTNLGKSVLAVQIGDSISRGCAVPGFGLGAPRQPILNFDFELSDKQFELRYSRDFQRHYMFDEHFIRIEINPDAAFPDSTGFEDYLFESIERAIVQTGARVLIIDNLTYLKNETERAKNALPLMKHLNALKKKHGLSILALAHTPKRDSSKPIVKNDLQGSSMLMNFCDSSFAIGESSKDKSIRYIKQIKARNTEMVYDAENVCICQLDKPDNFLQFRFVSPGTEREHLKQLTDKDREDLQGKVIELHQQGLSLRKIAHELSVSHMTVQRLVRDCNIV